MAQKTNRSAASQSKHDLAVKKIAEALEKKGYDVTADIKNYEKPKEIKGYIPDVIAKKGSERIIIEVETKESNKTDKDQQAAFKQFADEKVNTTFIKKVV